MDEERERLVYDAERLRSVADEYDRLRRAAGVSPQARGQRFNEVVAEVLRCWGVPAKTSVRTTGELDVAFALDGVRYVMEVKWEAKPTDTGKIAKLQKRVRQRLLGTYGIFLSMSGYSRPALADLTDGERLEVLLLDIGHFEAMVSGKISPSRLLSLVYDRAAFHGLAYTPISDLQLSDASGGPTQHSQTPGRSSAVPRQRTLPPPAGARSAEMFMFSGHRLIYWVLTGLLGLLTTLVALLTIAGPLSGWSVLGAIVALVALVLTIGFARMAQHPMRLIIGPHGIQLITRQGTTYLPWEEVQAVEIATVFGGPHLLIKTADASNYPTFGDKAGVGPRYVPSRAALSLCPINVLRAAPWQVSHALHSYAGGRMKSA